MPANTQCAANIRFTTTACEKRSHKNPVTNHFRSPAQKRNPVTGHLHATGPLQRQNASRDFRIFPTCRRQDGHIVRQIRCFLSPFFAIRGNASGNDRPAIRRPVTLRDDARPFPSHRHRPLSSQKTPMSGAIAVRIPPVRFGTCHSTCFIQQYFSLFFSLEQKMKKLIIASLALLLSACFPPPPHHGGGPGDNGGMHNPGGPGRGPGGGYR